MLVRINILTNLDYTYTKLRIKRNPEIIYKLTHIGWLVTYTPSILALDMALLGRYRYLNHLRPSTELTGTKKQEGLTVFDSTMRFTL